jgi:hypothetical protein
MKKAIGAGLLVVAASTSCLPLAVPAVLCGLWLVVKG